MLKRALQVSAALLALWGCSGTKPASDSAAAAAGSAKRDSAAAPVLVPEEEMLFSEVSEYVKLGQEGIRDSLWFQAGEDFDSALVRLSALEATDSLSPSVYSRIKTFRDSVQKQLIFTVAMTSQMGEPAPFTQQFDEEMEDVPDSSVKAMDSITHFIDPSKYTLPLTTPLEPRILQAMSVFMGPGRGYFTKWLTRKSRYESLVQQKLIARGLPPDLIYLAMCESGFNPKAWSKAAASGMWQFISGTGRRYGLQDDWWYDPRRDPLLATDAALEYLGDLHDEFQDWHMAMAAYNCGEGKIRRYLAQDSTRGYWKMPLPQETRFYVPKILAAMIISHDPKRYGFLIDNPEPALVFDTATVVHCLTIATIAKSAGVGEDTVLSLNPSLRRWCTPPNKTGFTVNLPTGTRETFLKNYDALDKTQLVNWHHHLVAKGETISSIAARYRVSVAAIKATNKIKGNKLSRGQSLLIPLAPGDAGRYNEPDVAEGQGRVAKFKGGTYKVHAGDNLFDIARRFGTTVSNLLAANNMKRGTLIRAGQRLKLGGKATAAGDDESDNHREPVAMKSSPGEKPEKFSGGDKAEKADKSEKADKDDSRAAASLVPREKAPRTTANVKAPAPGKFGVHTVEAGETLYSIGKSLGVSEEDLGHWNGIAGNRIQAGQKLKYLAPKNTPEAGKPVAQTGKHLEAEADATAGEAPGAEVPAGDDEPAKAEVPRMSPVAAAGFIGSSQPRAEEKQYYVVKAGDTLWDISTKYRTTVQKLKDLNGRLPPVLKPGTRIRVK